MDSKTLQLKEFFTERMSPSFLLLCILNNFWSTLHFSNNTMSDFIGESLFSVIPASAAKVLFISLPSIAAAIVFLVSTLYFWEKGPIINLKKQRMGLLYSACLGIACSLFGMIFHVVTLATLGLIFFGLLYLYLILVFTSRATQMNLKDALLYLALGAFGCVIFECIAYILSPVFPLTYAYLFTPCIIFFVLYWYDYKNPVALASIEKLNADAKPVPKGLFAILIVTGLIIGLTFSITLNRTESLEGTASIVNALASFLGGFLVLTVVKWRDFNFKFLLCKICLPVMALGIFICVVASMFKLNIGILGLTTLLTGSQAVVMLTWVICIYLCSYKKFPLVWIVSILFFGIFVGRSIGVNVGQGLFTYLQSMANAESFIYCLQFALLYFIAVLLANYDKALYSNSTWQEASFNTPSAADLTTMVYGTVRDNAHFTPREYEIFTMLAAGRNKKFIADKLCISDNTAKTHISRVYQKMNIHSQQELLDIVEHTKKLIEL